MGMNWVPLTREMVGSVVSAVVAPPTLIGAKGPKTRSSDLAQHIIHQSYGSQLNAAHLGDEHARQGVVAEAGTYGKPVGRAAVGEQHGGEQGAYPGAYDGYHGHPYEAFLDMPEVFAQLFILSDAKAYTYQQ